MSEARTWVARGGRRWVAPPDDEPRVSALLGLGLPAAVARVLAARGHDGPSARAFLTPDTLRSHDPGLLLNAERVVRRIHAAVERSEHIRLVTDYDVDGTTSCLILHAALDRLVAARSSAAVVSYHVPDRFTEGYGLSSRAVERAAADGVSLLITADIGVRDHVTVKLAAERGMDVLVCDHHLPSGESVPEAAYAVVCPPQPGCGYPNKALAACGVSLKLSEALLAEDARRDATLRSMTKLAAIGTIADVVDLGTAENRGIVARGLRALNEDRHSPGLTALLAVARNTTEPIDAVTVGWRIAPRINAAGRVDDANAVIRLLRERDPEAARVQAAQIDALNRARQDLQGELLGLAERLVADPPPAFVTVWGREDEGWHRGVVGIVASKLRERANRPVAVVSVLGGGVATGSVRSVPAVHAVRALDAAAPLLLRYGGHAAAAGFSVREADLPRLAELLASFVADHVGDEALVGEERVDLVLRPREVELGLVRGLEALEPTGKGNERPTVAVEGPVRVRSVTPKGHAFLDVGGAPAVWWNAGERAADANGATVAFGHLEIDRYRGEASARLTVDDVA